MKIIWSPLSLERLTEIMDYIFIDNPDACLKWFNEIFNKIDQLIEFPESGRIVPEMNRKNIREIIYKNYRIIYRIELKQILILTIRHFKQILPIEDMK